MPQVTKEAPSKERPSQVQSTTIITKTKEATAREALRVGLCAAGIDHDSWDYVADKCLASLREAGLLPKSLEEVVAPVDPSAQASVRVAVFPKYDVRAGDCGDWLPRSHEQAVEIARAIQSAYGGELKDYPDDRTPTVCVKQTLPDDMVKYVDYTVYYAVKYVDYTVYYDIRGLPEEV